MTQTSIDLKFEVKKFMTVTSKELLMSVMTKIKTTRKIGKNEEYEVRTRSG